MKIINNVNQKNMVIAMKKEANKKSIDLPKEV